MTLGDKPLGHRYIFGELLSLKRLISQSFSAFSASSLKNVSAVSSSHSLSETVLFFSLSFLRLICSEHYCHLLGICSEACCFSAVFTLLHNDILYYKHKKAILSSVLLNFFNFSSIYNAKKISTPCKINRELIYFRFLNNKLINTYNTVAKKYFV
jgi:hypothetical protein